MVCYREDSRAGHRSGDEDREVHGMVLGELIGGPSVHAKALYEVPK